MFATILEAGMGDLDLFDSRTRHAQCRDCTGEVRVEEAFMALCGRVAVQTRRSAGAGDYTDVCADCVALMHARRCPPCDG